jgi:hypothetical protein
LADCKLNANAGASCELGKRSFFRNPVVEEELPTDELSVAAAAMIGARLYEPQHGGKKGPVGFLEGLVSNGAAAGHRPALQKQVRGLRGISRSVLSPIMEPRAG